MIEIAGATRGVGAAQGLFASKAAGRDDESRLAATLRHTHGVADGSVRPVPGDSRDAKTRTVVTEIIREIQSRLPGRIRDLSVNVDHDQFILRGVSSSYYVKQVAGHLAMTTMDARLLGRLVNDIEVRGAH
jgi:hypothetical protein